MSHIIFISDIHLDESYPKRTEAFINFLAKIAPQADAVYILGDLFEAWIGDDDNSLFNQKIKAALKVVKIPIYFMPGNRDFLIGDKFCQDSGCILIKDPKIINLYGIPTLLTHGDLLCTKDIAYLKYRKFVHNSIYHKLFLLLPLKLRKYIANYLRIKSSKAQKFKTAEIKDVDQSTVNKLMQEYQVTQIIHGHTHHASISEHRISLPAWENIATYLYMEPEYYGLNSQIVKTFRELTPV